MNRTIPYALIALVIMLTSPLVLPARADYTCSTYCTFDPGVSDPDYAQAWTSETGYLQELAWGSNYPDNSIIVHSWAYVTLAKTTQIAGGSSSVEVDTTVTVSWLLYQGRPSPNGYADSYLYLGAVDFGKWSYITVADTKSGRYNNPLSWQNQEFSARVYLPSNFATSSGDHVSALFQWKIDVYGNQSMIVAYGGNPFGLAELQVNSLTLYG